MGGPVLDGALRIIELHQTINEPAGKTVPASNPVQDLELGTMSCLVKCAIGPAERAPIVACGRFHSSESRREHLKIRIRMNGSLDHLHKGLDIECRKRRLHSPHLQPKRGGEILFVPYHHIHLLCQFAVYFLCALPAADTLPQ